MACSRDKSQHLLLFALMILTCMSVVSHVRCTDQSADEPPEAGYGAPCTDNGTVCDPAEMLVCGQNGTCVCDNGTVWDMEYLTCGPIGHEAGHDDPMSWGKIVLIVGFTLAVVVLIAVFVIRKRMKDTTSRPTLDERRKSVLQEARGDIPMKQRKFSQHFA